jgi:hypothetical protein
MVVPCWQCAVRNPCIHRDGYGNHRRDLKHSVYHSAVLESINFETMLFGPMFIHD